MIEKLLRQMPLKELYELIEKHISGLLAMHEKKKDIPTYIIKQKQIQITLIKRLIINRNSKNHKA